MGWIVVVRPVLNCDPSVVLNRSSARWDEGMNDVLRVM